MGRADDVVRKVCEMTNIIPGAECVPAPPEFKDAFSVYSTEDADN